MNMRKSTVVASLISAIKRHVTCSYICTCVAVDFLMNSEIYVHLCVENSQVKVHNISNFTILTHTMKFSCIYIFNRMQGCIIYINVCTWLLLDHSDYMYYYDLCTI